MPARRFDVIRRLTTRMAEVKVLEAEVWGAPSVPLSDEEAAVLENLDGGRAVADLDERSVRRLAQAGVIDLI